MKRPTCGDMPVRSTWEETLIAIGDRFVSLGSVEPANCKPNQVAVIAGPFTDAETLTAGKDLANLMNSELICTEEKFPISRYRIKA